MDRIVSSPLLRTRETAAAWGVAVEIDERWIELDYGELDGVPLGEVDARGVVVRGGPTWTSPRPGGESIGALGARVRAACEDLRTEATDRDIVVVTHVSPIKAAVAWALGVADDVAWRMFVAPASVTTIATSARGASLHGFNVVDHLDGLE